VSTDFGVIGKPLSRIDGVARATGDIEYGVDVKLPGMLYGKILRGEYPHGRILHIDYSRAMRLPGVKAVVTGADDPGGRFGSRMADQTMMAHEKVRHVGEPVAAVAAVDEETASEALSLIAVEYEPLPAVFDPIEAMQPGAPIIHEQMHEYKYWEGWCNPRPGTNIINALVLRKGNIERGFAEASVVMENTYRTHAIQHASIEPHACVVHVGADGKVTVWSSTQAPYVLRASLAAALRIPASRVRVIATAVGGAYGGKVRLKAEGPAALLSLKTGRPVKIVHTRTEEFVGAVTRHPSVISMKTGARRDGTLVACRAEIILDTGAYCEAGEVVIWEVVQGAPGPYVVPNIWVDGYSVYTNRVPAGPCRGFGWPQVTWAYEGQMDALARELDMDPVEIRLKNAFEEGSISASGEVLHSVGFKECLLRVAKAVQWHERERRPGHGMGVIGFTKMSMPQTSSAAFVKLNEDGRIGLLTSAVDVGQGVSTALAQIVAEEIGVALDGVEVAAADTDTTPYDSGAISSRQTFHVGIAVQRAAADLKAQVLAAAAAMLEANPADLEIRLGRIAVRGVPGRAVSLADIGAATQIRLGHPILGRGAYRETDIVMPDPNTGQSPRPAPYWKYGAQAVLVDVDLETGRVAVQRVVSAHDCGRAINPPGVEGQIEGGAVMGLGYALMEEMIFEEGRVMNPNFMEYRVPTSADFPDVEPIIVEAPHREGPFGAKGVGEASTIGAAAAVRSAIADAVGVIINDLPITSEKVLDGIEAQRKAEPHK
jgi:carbon-monoxide dehydrogenase large subunit